MSKPPLPPHHRRYVRRTARTAPWALWTECVPSDCRHTDCTFMFPHVTCTQQCWTDEQGAVRTLVRDGTPATAVVARLSKWVSLPGVCHTRGVHCRAHPSRWLLTSVLVSQDAPAVVTCSAPVLRAAVCNSVVYAYAAGTALLSSTAGPVAGGATLWQSANAAWPMPSRAPPNTSRLRLAVRLSCGTVLQAPYDTAPEPGGLVRVAHNTLPYRHAVSHTDRHDVLAVSVETLRPFLLCGCDDAACWPMRLATHVAEVATVPRSAWASATTGFVCQPTTAWGMVCMLMCTVCRVCACVNPLTAHESLDSAVRVAGRCVQNAMDAMSGTPASADTPQAWHAAHTTVAQSRLQALMARAAADPDTVDLRVTATLVWPCASTYQLQSSDAAAVLRTLAQPHKGDCAVSLSNGDLLDMHCALGPALCVRVRTATQTTVWWCVCVWDGTTLVAGWDIVMPCTSLDADCTSWLTAIPVNLLRRSTDADVVCPQLQTLVNACIAHPIDALVFLVVWASAMRTLTAVGMYTGTLPGAWTAACVLQVAWSALVPGGTGCAPRQLPFLPADCPRVHLPLRHPEGVKTYTYALLRLLGGFAVQDGSMVFGGGGSKPAQTTAFPAAAIKHLYLLATRAHAAGAHKVAS